MSSFAGLDSSGFTLRRQSDIIAGINAALAQAFGSQVNLSPKSVLGNLTGVYSEPLALAWEALEAVYNAQFASGAEGVSVDNILELDGLSRLPAAPTVTAPNGVIGTGGSLLNGLVFYGTTGITVPAGTILQTSSTPPLSFTVDGDVTIGAPVNASQQVTFSIPPTGGFMTLTLTSSTGEQITTGSINAPFSSDDVRVALAAATNAAGKTPYADVAVQSDGNNLLIYFGLIEQPPGQPRSGGQPQALIGVNSSLTATSSGGDGSPIVVNAAVSVITYGAVAQGTGSATCAQDGPNIVAAGSLNVISTPVSGVSSVTNQIDCITGTLLESDADALLRRAQSINGNGLGKLGAIKRAVEQVPGVESVLQFQNVSNAALQNIVFPVPPPTTGTFSLHLAQGVTAPLPATASARDIQNAINALAGYNVIVGGSAAYGYQVDFNGSLGGGAQPLILIETSDATLGTIQVTYGRPPNSFEIVAFGGADADIQAAIFAAQPPGIGSYGSPTAIVHGTISANSSMLTLDAVTGVQAGLYVTGPSILNGTTVIGVSGNAVTLSQPSPIDGDGAYTFRHAALLLDEDNVGHVVSFTRAGLSIFYVAVRLLTDYYNTPGDSTSGVNPSGQFKPASILSIQNEIIALGNKTKAGGLVVTKGYNGLIGAFNNVPGVLDYALALQPAQRPSIPNIDDPMPDNVQLLPGQVASFDLLNVDISWT